LGVSKIGLADVDGDVEEVAGSFVSLNAFVLSESLKVEGVFNLG
jgi:hypothetical protein